MSKYLEARKIGITGEERKERISGLRYFIDKMRYETGQTPLTEEDSMSLASSWYGHFEEFLIPLPYLAELYKIALEDRAKNIYNTAFNIEDILRAWFSNLKEKIDNERRHPLNRSKKGCIRCDSDGMYYDKGWHDCKHDLTPEQEEFYKNKIELEVAEKKAKREEEYKRIIKNNR